MMQTLIGWITKRRGFFLFLGAIFSRAFFISLVYLTALLATRINPQENFVFRRNEIFRGPTEDVTDVEFRDDGKWLAAASQEGSIFLWDFDNQFKTTREQGLARMILPMQEGRANDVIFTHDNHYLLSAGTDQRIRFWNVSDLDRTSIEKYKGYTEQVNQSTPFVKYKSISLHESEILKLALSDDGRYLASADRSGVIYLFDLQAGSVSDIGKSAIAFSGHEVSITDVTFSPSTHWLAASDVAGRINIWDLTYLESDPAKAAIPARTIESRSRIWDIDFDLAFESESRQPERYLFSAGSDQQVHAWSLRGAEDATLPHLHSTTTVKLNLTRDNALNEYWLVSADQDGMIVVWDMNKWSGIQNASEGDEFFIVTSPRREITALETSLNADVPSGIAIKNRHLLVAGSVDRTVQVYLFGTPRNEWAPILLKPSSGQINDVTISPDNSFIITAGSDATIRLWESSRVTDVSLAFPTRQFVRFLVPILLALVLAIHTSSTFIMRTHHILKRENAIKYILTAIFGLNFNNFGLFLLSLLVPIWHVLVIENGKTVTDPDKFYAMENIGGPGKVVIRPGNVVAFQTIRTRTAIKTNETYFLRPFERIRKIISLEDQFHEYPEIETYTRDGIKITLKNVRIRYRVKFKNNQAIEGERYRSRYQDMPDPVDEKQLDRALEMLYWSEAIQAVIRTKVVHFVNIRPLDFFTAPNSFSLNESVREDFRKNIESQTLTVLSSFGAELFWMDIGVIEINPAAVREARMNLWSWQLRREADKLRAKGYSKLEAYRELGRIRGEAEIIKAIIEEIKRWDESLEKTEEKDLLPFASDAKSKKAIEEQTKRKRAAFLARLAELLRSYLRIASSEKGIFGTWNNPNDPNQKK